MIATFMPKPFADRTGSGLHLHLSLTSGGTPVFPADDDDRGLGPVPDRLLVHRRHPRPRLRAAGRRRPNGQLLQANRRDHHGVRRVVGADARPPTAATTARTTSACPTTSASNCAAATGRPTPTSPSPRHSAPASTASSAAPTPEPLAPQGRSALPPTLLHAVDELEGDPVVAGVLDAAGDGVAALLRRPQARGVLRLPQRRLAVGDRPLPDRVLNRRQVEGDKPCAGSSGCTCAPPNCIPGWVNCSPECCARWPTAAATPQASPCTATRVWSPPGQGCVSLLERRRRPPTQ